MEMPRRRASASAVVELALDDQASADAGTDPNTQEVLVGTTCSAPVLPEDADVDVVADGDLRLPELFRDEWAELDALGEAGNVGREQDCSRVRIHLARRADSDPTKVGRGYACSLE